MIEWFKNDTVTEDLQMENFNWQHITFKDGGNPYICTTEKGFERMKSKYNLTKIKVDDYGIGYWLAEERN